MKRAALIALLGPLAAVLSAGSLADDTADAAPAAAPVLVELFTSEGCSSCPPADALLSRLLAEQPVPGVEVVALGEHVDYWNDLGWLDRFSSAAFTERQQAYGADVFGSGTIYTPQIVVDGRLEAVGSNEAAVRRQLRLAAKRPKAAIAIRAEPADGGARIELDIDTGERLARGGPADVLVAVTEDGLVSDVRRGENRGRELTNDAVVRRLDVVGRLEPDQRMLTLATTVPIDAQWHLENLRIAAFVQERGSRRVLGAATARLTASSRTDTPANEVQGERL